MRQPLLTVLMLVLLVASASLQAGPIRVLVSIPPQKYLAQRVGGEQVDISTMLQPGHAPETFEPSPRQIAELAGASVYFRIGVPFERAWIEPLAAGNPGLEIVDCCPQLEGRSPQDGGGDPHVWLSPGNAMHMAEQMAETLARIDPAHDSEYGARLSELRADLRQLHTEIDGALRQRRTRYFIISHGSLGVFADAYGLTQIALEAGGHSVGPRQLSGIVERAREEKIRIVLVQKQFSRESAATLAAEIGARLVEVDPLAEDYLAGMRAISAAVAEATR